MYDLVRALENGVHQNVILGHLAHGGGRACNSDSQETSLQKCTRIFSLEVKVLEILADLK